MLETLFYLFCVLLFITTIMPRRARQKFADMPSYLLPLIRAALPWLAYYLAQGATQAWQFFIELGRLIEPGAYRLVTGRDPHARQGALFPPRGALHQAVQRQPPLPAAQNADLHGGDAPPPPTEIAPATADELRALARALRHNLTTPDQTKSGAIKAGWGLARSGTDPRYKRASQLYDLATAPEPVIRRRKA